MKIPFVGPSAQARSLNQNAERTVNAYLEQNPAPGREWALYGMPGLVLHATLPNSPIRGCIVLTNNNASIWVAGNKVYLLNGTTWAITELGTINTSTGRVGMATDGTEVLIVDGIDGWIATITTLTEIVDVDFPNGATVALYLDGFFLAIKGPQSIYWNETPGTGSAWNGLDFASAEGDPDPLVGGVVDGRTLWLVGYVSTELWRSTGDSAAPFQRMDGVFLQQGMASPWTINHMDNAVFWLSRNESGDGIVMRSSGSAPQRVSDFALETAMQGYSTLSDAYAYCLQWAGHSFYVLTFPTADVTWVYDAASTSWFQWAWRDPATNELHRHRTAFHLMVSHTHLVGDWETGKIYRLDADTHTDNGDAILRLRRTQTLRGARRLFFGELTVDMETAVATASVPDPQVMLRYSNDDGHTWSNEKQKSLGQVGEYGKRVKFGPTGASKPGRGRTWELSMTDAVKFCLFGADVDVEESA